jgi:hypothetical protein
MEIDREALKGILGSFRWLTNLWFINFQHFLSHVFHTCVVPHHKYARVDRAIHSTVRTMCGSRTGGRSLSCVMSD